VGEVISAAALVRALRSAVPGAPIFVSTTTLAGRDVARTRLATEVDGIFYAPVDYCWAVRAVLRRLRPLLVIVLETEIWPNLFNEAKRSGAALLVVNGRISDRALPRYLEFRWLFQPILALPDVVLAQSETDANRYIKLGADGSHVQVAGNLKYDFDVRRVAIAPDLQSYLHAAESVWVAASTMPPAEPGDPDEDDVVLDAWERIRRPGIRLVLVPRKPERFDVAASKLSARGIEFTRRSALATAEWQPVLLLDTMGELAGIFRFATVVFMGGTLASRGGHNILEPAAYGKPIIIGPHMENFRAIADKFRSASAVIEIDGPAALPDAVERALSGHAQRIADRAHELADSERGATARAVEVARGLYAAAAPRVIPYGPLHPVLWTLAKVWESVGRVKRTGSQPRRLSSPVISIGAIAIGGAGKTPLVRWLARELHSRGYKPAVLTRGYRRRTREPITLLRAGSEAPVTLTGEEAQMMLRDGFAHICIGADRYQVGTAAELEFQPDVFLLDDGFQHTSLTRDVDIVVLDDVDPYAGGAVFPLGRLREPVSSLERADLVIRKRLRVVRCIPALPSGTRIGGFCGLGNPASFWRTLESQGFDIVRRWVYPDHHRYTRRELRQMTAGGIEPLVTTEKDFYNLPPGSMAHYLAVEFEPDDPAAILELVESRLRVANRPST
jgi:3-deoxy-D-manno-octulosonic-acid transferase/tetraacyldisaccharide-1-P 4'-kinase